MAITFDYQNSIINLTSPETENLLMQNLINAIRTAEVSDEGMQYEKIASGEGKIDIGGGVVSDITVTLLGDWQIKHAAGSYQAILSGGQVVGGLGDNPVAYVAGVQVKMIQSTAGIIATVNTGSGLTPEEQIRLKDIHQANYNKRTVTSDVITIFEDDKITVKKEFDTNADLTEITPR